MDIFRGHRVLLCALSILSMVAVAKPAHDNRPNILLIVAEDMSSRVGAYGDTVAQTPAIDALAQQGVRYTNVFTASGVCAPSRSALITGVYPQSMGTQHMRTSNLDYLAVPPAEVKAFPELLRRAGYETANAVKTDYQFGNPFTVWDVNAGKLSTPPDLALWRRLPGENPFFAMINLMSTHESRLATADTRGVGHFAKVIRSIHENRAKNVKPVTSPEDVVVPPYYPDTKSVRASIAQLYDNIHYMDGEVGQILANLEADGLADDTVVIWTTDHGDGLPRAKRSVYDSGLKVPLIIRFPDRLHSGKVSPQMVSFVDLAPAILGMAGVEVPAFIQGRDFLSNRERRYIYAARDRMNEISDRVRTVRDKRYQYIRNYMPELPYFRPLSFRDMFPVMQELWRGHRQQTLTAAQAFYFTAPRPPEELYDTLTDPFEVHNLADDPGYVHILTRLRGEMDRWEETVGDRSNEPEKAMIARMWPGQKQPVTAPPEIKLTTGKGGTLTVALDSATPGASIGYRLGFPGREMPWQLYSQPVRLPEGGRLEAKAVRYGFTESDVRVVDPDEKP